MKDLQENAKNVAGNGLAGKRKLTFARNVTHQNGMKTNAIY